jgi:membrane protease YdiL (CAAX protease family)
MNSKTIYSAAPAKGWLSWALLAPFLCVAFVALPEIGLSRALERLELSDAAGNPIGVLGLCAFLLVPFSLTGALVVAWVRFVERGSLATVGLVRSGAVKSFVRGHVVGLATAFALVAAIWITGGLRAEGYAKALGSPDAMLKIAALLVCFAVQSSVEEILFRGWLLTAISRKLNVAIGIVVTSLLFALLHYEPHQRWLITLAIVLFSVFACCWAIQAGNVWCVMGWHAGWNWLLAIGFELPVTGINTKLPALLVKLTPIGPACLTGGAQGPEGSYWYSLLFVAAIAVIGWRFKRARGPMRPASASMASA